MHLHASHQRGGKYGGLSSQRKVYPTLPPPYFNFKYPTIALSPCRASAGMGFSLV